MVFRTCAKYCSGSDFHFQMEGEIGSAVVDG